MIDLVLVVPRGNPAGVHGPGDLARPEVRRVALAGERVPAGKYATQALRAAGVFDRLTIARAQHVRAALTWVETGEAQAGVVYATDARASGRAMVVHTFAPETHDPIVYPAVLLSRGEAARRFYAFLAGDEARAILDRHGFVPAP
jgi:molybdate transport system substrate-binding protein